MTKYLDKYMQVALNHTQERWDSTADWRKRTYGYTHEGFAEGLLSSLCGQDNHHILYVEDDSFTLEHPLTEKLTGTLRGCKLHTDLTRLDRMDPGVYHIYETPNAWEIFPEVKKTSA